MFDAYKEARKYYKELKREAKARKILLSQKPDYAMLENFIKRVNENPGLKITVYLRDGAKYELSTYAGKPLRDYEMINGNLEIR